MAKQDNEVRKEPPAALPLRTEAPNAPPLVAQLTQEPHSVSNPGKIGSPVGKKLIVGSEIELSGNISACERLVVEGRVEAELHDCREIEIARTGTFKGSAAIEMAEIRGNFEGTLTVRDTLIIRSSGRVTGTIRFGKLEIERGGEVVGDIGLVADNTES